MKNKHFLTITVNFLAVVLLISLIAAPIYFATNFAKVAGVKSESKYLIVSQIDKFPNLTLSQTGDTYQISFTKMGTSQVFLDVLILNNPTTETKTYSISVTQGFAKVFFGHYPQDIKTKIAVPSQASIPVSLLSSEEDLTQEVEFKITLE